MLDQRGKALAGVTTLLDMTASTPVSSTWVILFNHSWRPFCSLINFQSEYQDNYVYLANGDGLATRNDDLHRDGGKRSDRRKGCATRVHT